MQGVWIMEIGELAGIKKAEVEEIKQFLSKDDDTFRMPYDKYVVTRKRQIIFIATTNDYTPLKDQSGGRRFWPVEVTKFPNEEIPRDQLWAEAIAAYDNLETHYLSREEELLAKESQDNFTEINPSDGVIQEYLDLLLPADWDKMDAMKRMEWLWEDPEMRESGVNKRTQVCAIEIWVECFKKDRADADKYKTKGIVQFLSRLKKWKSIGLTRVPIYGPQRCFAIIGSTKKEKQEQFRNMVVKKA